MSPLPKTQYTKSGDLHLVAGSGLSFEDRGQHILKGVPYFFRQCYIATDADEKPLRQVVEAIGDDNIVVSTDYPHSDGLFPVAIEEFVRLEGVSDKSKAKILWDNCARLYKLPGST
jgi:predicted TIM-barrel fold metal-dependent hydrolase